MDYDFKQNMSKLMALPCDGCGQMASREHMIRRLQRLEWTTRYRPVHIQTLLLGAIAPKRDEEFLYSAEGRFEGEAGALLDAIQIPRAGKSGEMVLSEVQRRGLLLTYVLECAVEEDTEGASAQQLLEKKLPSTIARIRRSLRPKRIVLISKEIEGIAGKLRGAELNCPVIAGAFLRDGREVAGQEEEFRRAVEGATA